MLVDHVPPIITSTGFHSQYEYPQVINDRISCSSRRTHDSEKEQSSFEMKMARKWLFTRGMYFKHPYLFSQRDGRREYMVSRREWKGNMETHTRPLYHLQTDQFPTCNGWPSVTRRLPGLLFNVNATTSAFFLFCTFPNDTLPIAFLFNIYI